MKLKEGLKKGVYEVVDFLRVDWDDEDDDDGGLEKEIEVFRFAPIEKPSLASVLAERVLRLMPIEVRKRY
ncbi:MAG: hypothetical protein ACI4A3_07760 [Lachnospiraceae bacterium]